MATPFGSFDCFVDDPVTRDLVKFGGYQRSDVAMLLSFVRPGDCVLDIGAHIGTFSVPLGKAVGADGRVVAFEPLAEYFALLERNIEGNGLADVVVPARKILGGYGDLPDELHEELKGQLDGVPVVTLDEWWRAWAARPSSIQAIKIDVQGSEHDVLMSGTEMIESFRPVVQFEVDVMCDPNFSALDAFFASRGYQFFINLARRDGASDTFRLAELKRLGHVPRAYSYVFDVVAVHRDSSRMPHRASSASAAELHLLELGVRRRMKHVLQSVTRHG